MLRQLCPLWKRVWFTNDETEAINYILAKQSAFNHEGITMSIIIFLQY